MFKNSKIDKNSQYSTGVTNSKFAKVLFFCWR